MPPYSNLLFCSALSLNEAGTGLFGSLQNFATRDWVPMTQLEDGGHPPQTPDETRACSTERCIILCFFQLQPVYGIRPVCSILEVKPFYSQKIPSFFLGVGAEWLCLLKAIPYSAAAQACRWMPRPGVVVFGSSLNGTVTLRDCILRLPDLYL